MVSLINHEYSRREAHGRLAWQSILSNAAVQRPRDHVSSASQMQNEMAHLQRARDAVSRSAATG